MSIPVADLRNVAFVGHPSSGKTTLVDALAWKAGASDRKGSVADRTSICDTEPEEQEKQHTLQSASVYATHGGLHFHLIDTPGYPDFVAETNSAIFGASLVVGVLSATGAVSYDLIQKMATAARQKRGRAIVVTHVDGENADFDALVDELRAKIGEVCVPFLVPDATGSAFSSVSKVLADAEGGWRKRLFDRVMDACDDEELMLGYLEDGELTVEQLATLLPAAIAKGTLVPILACNPEADLGVDEVLAFLGDYAPSPLSQEPDEADDQPVPVDPSGELLGVVFSVRSDPHVGRICLARIVQGEMHAAEALVKVGADGRGEKPGGLFHLVGGKKRDGIESASAGDIVAFSKVEALGCGDSFTKVGSGVSTEIEFIRNPIATVSMAVTPKSRSDEQKIGEALPKLAAEDPTITVHNDPLTRELVVTGTSDLHLQVMQARLKRRYGVEIETHLPRIAYQETVTKPSEGHYRHKKQSGGRGQFGECYVRVRPAEKGAGLVFVDKVVGGAIPRNLIPAVEKGVREVASRGVLTESRVVDVEVEVYDGKFHAVDSDEASFKIAGGRAFKDGFAKAGPVLLEPIMAVEIHVPTDDAGAIFSDVTSQRRGHVLDQESAADGAITIIRAHAPLATMQTYHRDLKSQTAGEGSYTMVLDHYAAVPAGEQQKILAAAGRKQEEE